MPAHKSAADLAAASDMLVQQQHEILTAAPPPNDELAMFTGKDTHVWRSDDGTKTIIFGRPEGPISSKVARLLGPQQADNSTLNLLYRSILAIKSRNGEPMHDLYTENHFLHAENWFETDENLQSFTLAYQLVFFPKAFKALDQAREAGESNESIQRIIANIEKDRVKN